MQNPKKLQICPSVGLNLVKSVSNIKQDFIICDYCKSVLVYKSSTRSSCMISHSRSCSSKENQSDLPDQQRKINHYYKSTSNERKRVPKKIKNDIILSCVEFVVQDGRAFQLLQGPGLIRLTKQLFESGRYMSSSTDIQIEDLLRDPTTVSNFRCIQLGKSLTSIFWIR